MKFLVESEIFPGAPIAQLAEALERTKKHVTRSDSPVKVECVYGVAGRRGAIAICDAADADSLHQLLATAPLFHFERLTVTPLVSFEESVTVMSAAAAAVEQQ
jgi:muconolactone delta-isomerase